MFYKSKAGKQSRSERHLTRHHLSRSRLSSARRKGHEKHDISLIIIITSILICGNISEVPYLDHMEASLVARHESRASLTVKNSLPPTLLVKFDNLSL